MNKKRYVYDGHTYTEKELIGFANATSLYGWEDEGGADGQAPEIKTIEDALHYLGEHDVQRIEEGGNVVGQTPREFFSSLDLSALPAEAAEYINTQLLADLDIDLLTADDEDFLQVKKIIDQSFVSSGDSGGNATIAKLQKEIEDLTSLIEMEDDGPTKIKLQKEIEDLNQLIELEK